MKKSILNVAILGSLGFSPMNAFCAIDAPYIIKDASDVGVDFRRTEPNSVEKQAELPSFLKLAKDSQTIFAEAKTENDQSKPATEPKKDRLDLGVGYTGNRGANVYGKYHGVMDDSTIQVNTQLALSDKYADIQQLFATDETIADKPIAVGYSSSYRDFEIVPHNAQTQNTDITGDAIAVATLSQTSNVVATAGVEQINSKTGMAGATGSQTMLPLTLTYKSDARTHPQFPTEGFGHYIKAKIETSAFGEYYAKGTVRGQLDIPLNNLGEKFALSLKGYAGLEESLGNKDVPITKRFYLENGSLVRGYAFNAFGYSKNGLPMGGSSMATASIEFWTPLFHDDLRGYTFVDAGLMRGFGAETGIKTSAGAGVAWNSPIGVLSVSYGQALDSNNANKQGIGFGLGINY